MDVDDFARRGMTCDCFGDFDRSGRLCHIERARRKERVAALVALFVAWDSINGLDNLLGIPAGGLLGFRNSTADYPGTNTTYLSVLLCPITFVFGIVVGEFIGWIYDRKTRHRNAALHYWNQRPLSLEFMHGLSYTTIIELAEPLAGRRGSAWDR